MTHTYQGITTPDTTYTSVSDVTPIIGNIEEKFTWVYIDPTWDTWIELLAREHWVDWYFGIIYIDTYTSKTTPSYTYSELTK